MAVHTHEGDRLNAIEATVLDRALGHRIVVYLHHSVRFCRLPEVTESDVAEIGHLLGAKHAAERLQRCWVHPSGQAFSIKHLRKSFKVGCIPLLSHQMAADASSHEIPAHTGGDNSVLVVITRTTYLVPI